MTAQVGVAGQPADDAQRRDRRASLTGEVQRHAEVRQFRVQPVQLVLQAVRAVHAPVDRGRDPLDEVHQEPQVGMARGLHLPGLGQPLQRVLPDRAEQLKAGACRGVLHPQQRLVREPGQQLQQPPRTDVVPGRHPLGGRQRKAAREHSQPPEHRPLVRLQQVVTPVQGRPQGLMPGRCRAGSADQHPEHVLQPLGQLLRGQDPHPGRGQLDGQRQAVQPPAYLHDGDGVVVGQPERRQHGLCPLLEEPDRIELLQGGHGYAGARVRER